MEEALREIAARLEAESDALLAANASDLDAARETLAPALQDRLRMDEGRLLDIARQIAALAELPPIESLEARTEVDGMVVETRRVPIGVVGANYEARANVTVDVASQLIKSRNGGVLRTGGAALRTATAMIERAIAPALGSVGASPDAIQLVGTPAREAAGALVSFPDLVPLVILRGSGATTAELAREAATHGVRTLAHAEGGGVMYVHPSADRARASELIEQSLDRLGVCNRLNLLLVDEAIWDEFVPGAVEQLRSLEIEASLPPHPHPVGYEWALDDEHAATVTLAPAGGPAAAAQIANRETSGLAATIVAEDEAAVREFLSEYGGTGAFWNVTTRVLDGFRLFKAPETGINIDRVPGPRGPVTYRDLYLRQVVVTPTGALALSA